MIGFSRTGNHPSRKIRQEETNLDAADGHKDNIKINLKYTEWNRITPTDFLKISEGRKLTTGFTSFISCGLQGGKDMQSDFGGQTASKTDAWEDWENEVITFRWIVGKRVERIGNGPASSAVIYSMLRYSRLAHNELMFFITQFSPTLHIQRGLYT
jgi:hypothetical protein